MLGEDVLAWVDEQLNRDTALSGLRRVQLAIVYLESLPKDRAATVCRRASAYGLGRLSELKNVVERCLDLAPPPEGLHAPAPWPPGSPRLARALRQPLERPHALPKGQVACCPDCRPAAPGRQRRPTVVV